MSGKPTPARPSDLPYGRWLGDFDDLSSAEAGLVSACWQNKPFRPISYDNSRPCLATDENRIRGELIRFLVLGGDGNNGIGDRGVDITGCYITGNLDLHWCDTRFRIKLTNSVIENVPRLIRLKISEIALHGCDCPGIDLDGASIHGSLFFDEGFRSSGEIRLVNASIGGDLYLDGGYFCNEDISRPSLNLDGCHIERGLHAHRVEKASWVDFTCTKVSSLTDEIEFWPEGSILDGFVYDRIVGIALDNEGRKIEHTGDLDAERRIGWLMKQKPSNISREDWKSQPWEQIITVLRNSGHNAAAAQIAIAKQNQMRKAQQVGQRKPLTFHDSKFPEQRAWLDRRWNPISNFMTVIWHVLYGSISAYGYRPQRIVYLTAALITLSSLAFYTGRSQGLMGPSNPLIHMSSDLGHCGPNGFYWTNGVNCPVPPEYSTFQPFLYALDVTLPLVDLHQEADWGPIVSDDNGKTLWGGRVLRWLMWIDIIAGWFASLMFAAVISRLFEKG